MTNQTQKPFRYKPNYVAVWPDASAEALLHAHGVRRRVHLTTFFDGYGQMSSLTPYPWRAPMEARIAAVVEWKVGNDIHVIAEMADCSWTQAIHDHYVTQGARADMPHRPHVTLEKRVAAGTAAKFQDLLGKVICFDRHGRELDDRPLFTVAGDIVLRDWSVQVMGADKLRVSTPPMGSGIRESHMASRHSDDGEGFFMLAKAMLAAQQSRGPAEVEELVETVAMSILGKSVDPVPGVNWQCDRRWNVNDVRQAVRMALDSVGITKSRTQGHIPADAPTMVSQLLREVTVPAYPDSNSKG
jgi:hypothetical protein